MSSKHIGPPTSWLLRVDYKKSRFYITKISSVKVYATKTVVYLPEMAQIARSKDFIDVL